MGVPCADPPLPRGLVASYRNFFLHEYAREPGANLYLEIFQDGVLFPLQRQMELTAMMQRAREYNPHSVMEIGTDKAGGLYHWCKCFPNIRNVIACEVRGTPYSDEFEKAFPHINFLWLPHSSYDVGTARTVMEFLGMCGGAKLDCLFIDGDKTAFEEDFDTYLPDMAPSSVVFMHDIQDEAPRSSYDAVCSRGYHHEEIINLQDSMTSLMKEKMGMLPSCEHEVWLRHWRGRSCGVGCIYIGPMV